MNLWCFPSRLWLVFCVYTLFNCQPVWALFCKDVFSVFHTDVVQQSYTDYDFRKITGTYGNPPATYSIGGSYGAALENIPLFRGVAGPDHDFKSILRFMSGNRRDELMSPYFRRALDAALVSSPLDSAYETARRETATEIVNAITQIGLESFAFNETAGSSAGLSHSQKRGRSIKFSNSINTALGYAASNFQRNLAFGRRLNPVVFDASQNGGLTLGHTDIPKPGYYHEYDFLSNVSIRHINAIFIGLVQPDSRTAWDMPWIKISPRDRLADGAYQSFFVEFVTVERKILLEIYEKTGLFPEHELTNLTPQKVVGLFNLNGPIQLSPQLNATELLSLKPLFNMLNSWKQSP